MVKLFRVIKGQLIDISMDETERKTAESDSDSDSEYEMENTIKEELKDMLRAMIYLVPLTGLFFIVYNGTKRFF